MNRDIQLHIGPDGTISLTPIYVDKHSYQDDWRGPVVDALINGDVKRARKVLNQEYSQAIDSEAHSRDAYTLPFFSVDTIEQAKSLQVRFCKLQYDKHPISHEAWYVLNPGLFDGRVDGIMKVAELFEKAYQGTKYERVDRIDDKGNIREHTRVIGTLKTLCGLTIHYEQDAAGNGSCKNCERKRAKLGLAVSNANTWTGGDRANQ